MAWINTSVADNPMVPKPHKILKIIRQTSAEYTFRVEFPDAFNTARHGQICMLSIPKVGEAPISISGKGPDWFEFTIRRVGRMTQAVFALKEGENIFLRGPYGHSFPVEEMVGKNLVIVTGGTAFSPIKTLMEQFYNNDDERREVYLIVGFKNRNAVLFGDVIEQFRTKFHVIKTLDSETAEGFETGMVTEHIKKIPFEQFEPGDYSVICVGPPVMLKYSTLELLKCGADPNRMWVSFERRMACAIGKCGHCKINDTYICLEGPVLHYPKAITLID